MRWDDVSLWAASSSEIPTGFGSERAGVHHLREGRISSQAATWSTPRNHVSAILCFAVISSSISLLGPLGPSPRALKTRLGRADPSQATKAWLPAVKSKVSLPESASCYRSWRGIGGTATYSGVALTQVIRLDH